MIRALYCSERVSQIDFLASSSTRNRTQLITWSNEAVRLLALERRLQIRGPGSTMVQCRGAPALRKPHEPMGCDEAAPAITRERPECRTECRIIRHESARHLRYWMAYDTPYLEHILGLAPYLSYHCPSWGGCHSRYCHPHWRLPRDMRHAVTPAKVLFCTAGCPSPCLILQCAHKKDHPK